MMGRAVLPNRRPDVVESFEWRNTRYDVTFGFGPDGKVREVFIHGAKVGSEMDGLLSDCSVLASVLLQHGPTAADLDRHLGREPAELGASAASIIGYVMRRAAAVEAEEGGAMIESYRAVAGVGSYRPGGAV